MPLFPVAGPFGSGIGVYLIVVRHKRITFCENEIAYGDFVSLMLFIGFADHHAAGVPINPNARLFVQRAGLGEVFFYLFKN